MKASTRIRQGLVWAVWAAVAAAPAGCRYLHEEPAVRAHPPPWGRRGLREEVVQKNREQAENPPRDVRPPLPMEFVRIPAGVFVQGAPVPLPADDPFTARDESVLGMDWSNARPTRIVRIDSFEMSRYEITQYQWTCLMGTNPSGATKGMALQTTENFPVENVSWNDVQEFIRRLNERDKSKGFRYRLPTEAEWEYACGGDATLFSWGNDWKLLPQYAWTWPDSPRGTHPVGLLRPNRFGLYDMHGNVFEWCQDWYRSGYPTPPPGKTPSLVRNPKGPESGPGRVIRGGAWTSDPIECIAFYRTWAPPSTRTWNIGFRLVRERIGGKKSPTPGKKAAKKQPAPTQKKNRQNKPQQ